MGKVIILNKKSDSEELERMLREGIIQGPVDSQTFSLESVWSSKGATRKCNRAIRRQAKKKRCTVACCTLNMDGDYFAFREVDFYQSN